MRVVSVQDADKGTPVQELRQMEAATEDIMGREKENVGKTEESVHNSRPVCGRAMHQSDPGFLANDEGGGEGRAARAATGTEGGEGRVGGQLRDTGSRGGGDFRSFRVPLSFLLSLLSFVGQARRGQVELPRAASRL